MRIQELKKKLEGLMFWYGENTPVYKVIRSEALSRAFKEGKGRQWDLISQQMKLEH